MNEELKFFHESDYWGYTTDQGYYYFQSRYGEMLFGDKLPSLDEQGKLKAEQILRGANIAHDYAIKLVTKNITKLLKTL